MRTTELGTVQSGGIRLDHEVRRRVVEHALLDDHPRCEPPARHPDVPHEIGDGLPDGVASEPHRRTGIDLGVGERRQRRDAGRTRRRGEHALHRRRARTGAPVVVTGSHGPSIAGTTDVAFRQEPRMPRA